MLTPDEMLSAAVVIEKVNAHYRMPPDAYWRPSTLRKESKFVAEELEDTK